MSKVICDVCGTSFPETDENCPLCGCAKTADAVIVPDEPEKSPADPFGAGSRGGKGGRFAKGNQRRSAFEEPARKEPERKSPERKEPERRRRTEHKDENRPQESNKGLIAVVIVLLLAIVMVVVYIGVTVFLSGLTNQPEDPKPSASTPAETDPSDGASIPCTELTIDKLAVEFVDENKQVLLEVHTVPANTTDVVEFASSNPDVAIVDRNGLIIPVGYGEAVITVTCGDQVKECAVICTFGATEPTTEPTEPVPTAPAGFVLKLVTYKDSGEITLSKEGEVATIYKETMGVKASDITWVSADPAVATVVNGKVTGVDRGTTKITATIGDQTVTCVVRCAFDAADPTETVGITISHTDVTLRAGEFFYLSLKNPDSSKVQDVVWVASEEGLVEIEGNKITALDITKSTSITISTEHEGVEYSCILYLHPPKQEETTPA